MPRYGQTGYRASQRAGRAPAAVPGFRPDAASKADLWALSKADRQDPGGVPPVARLSFAQLHEVERLAGLGLNLFQIGVRLRFEPVTWERVVSSNVAVREAFRAGRVGEAIAHAETVRRASVEAGEWGAARWWLERFGGTQFAPRAQQVQMMVQTDAADTEVLEGQAEAVFDSVDTAIGRQRELIEQGIRESELPPEER